MSLGEGFKPFSGDTVVCPKCGFEGTLSYGTRYCPGNTRKCAAQGEHLHRTCNGCLYHWVEACADEMGVCVPGEVFDDDSCRRTPPPPHAVPLYGAGVGAGR